MTALKNRALPISAALVAAAIVAAFYEQIAVRIIFGLVWLAGEFGV